jgi:hypothetical protein
MVAQAVGQDNPFFDPPAAQELLAELLRATDGRTGDRLSGAIRAVTLSGSSLPRDQVDAAVASITLLLAQHEPTMLDGADNEQVLRRWLHDVDTELTPGRRLAAGAALARIGLSQDNEWYAAHQQAGTLTAALSVLRRLRDELADAEGS